MDQVIVCVTAHSMRPTHLSLGGGILHSNSSRAFYIAVGLSTSVLDFENMMHDSAFWSVMMASMGNTVCLQRTEKPPRIGIIRLD